MMKGKGWKEGHKYWGLTKEQIKILWSSNTSAELGTNLHYEIECFMNEKLIIGIYTHKELYDQYQYSLYLQDQKQKEEQKKDQNKDQDQDQKQNIKKSIEWYYFIQFIKDTPTLKPYRTEWLIYHEDLKISGSIDMIYENEDGTLSIYDWKRSKNITRVNLYNANFWHYALQLNMYKMILEEKYDKKVKDLYLVRLYPDPEKVEQVKQDLDPPYELIKIPILNKEIMDLKSDRIKQLKNII